MWDTYLELGPIKILTARFYPQILSIYMVSPIHRPSNPPIGPLYLSPLHDKTSHHNPQSSLLPRSPSPVSHFNLPGRQRCIDEISKNNPTPGRSRGHRRKYSLVSLLDSVLQLSPESNCSAKKSSATSIGPRPVVPLPIDPLNSAHKQLLYLRHAYQCHSLHCELVSCGFMKKLLSHITSCKLHNNKCRVQACQGSRRLLCHYHNCNDSKCTLCEPVRRVVVVQVRRKRYRQNNDLDFKAKRQRRMTLPPNNDVLLTMPIKKRGV